jgi:5'-3' exonuclease
MILIDYNGIAIGNIIVQKLQVEEDLIRHMILNSIRMYKQKFKEYGDVVIVADAGGNWRKNVYPEYKASRKKNRDESSLNWDEIFRITNMVREEIEENLPYRVVHVWGCEADDAIAQIALETQEFGKYEEVMIVSADKDFAQLQIHPNISQYSPMTKKFIKEENPRLFLQEHILSGDNGDGVPNVLSDDKVFVEKRRQEILSKKKKEALLEDPKVFGEEVYRNYLRNKKMIDLTECPELVKKEIINNYENQNPEVKRKKVLPYLIQKNCKLLIESVQEFL